MFVGISFRIQNSRAYIRLLKGLSDFLTVALIQLSQNNDMVERNVLLECTKLFAHSKFEGPKNICLQAKQLTGEGKHLGVQFLYPSDIKKVALSTDLCYTVDLADLFLEVESDKTHLNGEWVGLLKAQRLLAPCCLALTKVTSKRGTASVFAMHSMCTIIINCLTIKMLIYSKLPHFE